MVSSSGRYTPRSFVSETLTATHFLRTYTKEKTMPKVFWLNAYVKGDECEKTVILRHLDSQYPAANLKIERKI